MKLIDKVFCEVSESCKEEKSNDLRYLAVNPSRSTMNQSDSVESHLADSKKVPKVYSLNLFLKLFKISDLRIYILFETFG